MKVIVILTASLVLYMGTLAAQIQRQPVLSYDRADSILTVAAAHSTPSDLQAATDTQEVQPAFGRLQ